MGNARSGGPFGDRLRLDGTVPSHDADPDEYPSADPRNSGPGSDYAHSAYPRRRGLSNAPPLCPNIGRTGLMYAIALLVADDETNSAQSITGASVIPVYLVRSDQDRLEESLIEADRNGSRLDQGGSVRTGQLHGLGWGERVPVNAVRGAVDPHLAETAIRQIRLIVVPDQDRFH